ncbi:MAG: dihydrodipicolinate synthase family protein [Rhodothermales bacterium]
MSDSFSFSGVIPALVSPLTESGEANVAATRALVRAMLTEDVPGLYILGSTGQGIMLPEATRRAIAETVADEVAGRIPVVAHVGAVTTDEGIRLARHAASCGIDGVSAIAPVIGGGLTDIVFRHYEGIAGATDLLFVVYHFDGASGMAQGAAAYGDRLLSLPNIAGIKMTSRDMHAMADLHAKIGRQIEIYSGADELMCQAVLSGAKAAIGTYYNVWPRACALARDATMTGRVNEAVSFMHAFRKGIFDTVFDAWGFMRAALRLRFDVDVGPARAPLGSSSYVWEDAEVSRILKSVDDAAPGSVS